MNTSLLFSEEQIQKKIKELALQINKAYGGGELLAVGILRGAFMFYTELLKNLNQDITCGFCCVSFYGSSKKASPEASLSLDVKAPVKGKKVLLIDCIADYGHSLEFVRKSLQSRNPHSIKTAVLIAKPMAQKNTVIDFQGFTVPQDVFVIGWGIDYNNKGRNLNYFAQVNDLN